MLLNLDPHTRQTMLFSAAVSSMITENSQHITFLCSKNIDMRPNGGEHFMENRPWRKSL